MNVTEKRFLTYREAAQLLRCSEKTLYSRVRDGMIRPLCNGRLKLFTIESLMEFLQRGNDTAPQSQQITEDAACVN